MNIFLKFSVLASFLIFSGCGDGHDHEHKGHDHKGHDHGGHAHEAPHGGALVLLGEHGTGFHLEVILGKEGILDLYVLDGEVENFVRVSQEELSMQVTAKDSKSQSILMTAVEDAATGESIGNTSHFRAQTEMKGVESFDAILSSVKIKGTVFEKVSFSYPQGNE
jgi:hypothetical protein